MRKIALVLSLFCCLACSRQPQSQQQTIYTLPVDSTTQEWAPLKSLEYIPLETTDASLIAGITKLIYHNDTFYILDMTAKKVLLFSRKGKFLKSIHKVGQGPGEYTNPCDIDVDEKGNVYLSDIDSHRILVYEHGDENKCQTINPDVPFLFFAVKGESIYLSNLYQEGEMKTNLAVYNRKEQQLTVLKENTLPEGNNIPLSSPYFFRSGKEVFFHERFLPTIYQLEEDGTASLYIHLESEQFPDKEEIAAWAKGNPQKQFMKRRQYLSDFSSCYETDEYLFLSDFSRYMLFNKKTRQLQSSNQRPKPLAMLSRKILATTGKQFISFWASSDESFRNALEGMTAEEKARFKEVSEESNPILVLFGF